MTRSEPNAAFQNRSKISNRHQRKSHSLKNLHQPLKEVVNKRPPPDTGEVSNKSLRTHILWHVSGIDFRHYGLVNWGLL
jgi:hypothetical protein